jgi:hypothetical protein
MQWQLTVNCINPDGPGRPSNAGKDGLSMQEKAALRNSPDYDDWEFGMEPIPGDASWTSSNQQRP